MARFLHLTAPLMEGDDVLSAQKILQVNRFGNFRPGPVDGVFGEQTAGACRRAKYWLGFPTSKINGGYGDTLREFLVHKPLPVHYKYRRQARLRAAQNVPLRVRAWQRAVGQIAIKEHPPGSNIVKFSEWYGLTGPWCAMFITWCYVMAGAKKTFVKGDRYAYTPYMTRDARNGVNAMALLNRNEVKRGDIVMFDWGGAGLAGNPYFTDHVGMFDAWISKDAGTFKTIEGNTAIGNDSNGGEVMRRERELRQVSAFIRAEV